MCACLYRYIMLINNVAFNINEMLIFIKIYSTQNAQLNDIEKLKKTTQERKKRKKEKNIKFYCRFIVNLF